MQNMNYELESVLDLNNNNIWNVEPTQIAQLWEKSKSDPDFRSSEEKVLNIIRLAFKVVHFDPSNEREASRYENENWVIFTRENVVRGSVAIQRKHITQLTDLSYENVKHITTSTLLELIDRNFGGGWDSIQLSQKDIIESGFDISTTQLPTSRIHMPGSLVEKKIAQGYEVLEITKGTWTEAIFAKKKEPADKVRFANDNKYDEEGNLLKNEENDDDELPINLSKDEESEDDTFYSCYSAEAEEKNEEEEENLEGSGLTIDED